MLIFYGVNSRTNRSRLFGGLSTCPECQSSKFVRIRAYNFAHIFWIPLFPYNIQNVFVCTNCGKAIDKSNADPQLIRDAKAARISYGVPISGFIIPLIIASIFLLVQVNQVFKKTDETPKTEGFKLNYSKVGISLKDTRLQNPEVGDIITFIDKEKEYHNPDYPLEIIKLIDIEEDNYTFIYSQFTFTDVTAMYVSIERQQENFWYDESKTISKDIYNSLLETGYFIDIFKENI